MVFPAILVSKLKRANTFKKGTKLWAWITGLIPSGSAYAPVDVKNVSGGAHRGQHGFFFLLIRVQGFLYPD